MARRPAALTQKVLLGALARRRRFYQLTITECGIDSQGLRFLTTAQGESAYCGANSSGFCAFRQLPAKFVRFFPSFRTAPLLTASCLAL